VRFANVRSVAVESKPQRLKPRGSAVLSGKLKVVPFPKHVRVQLLKVALRDSRVGRVSG
jgi:hypothetical protein